MTDRWRVELGDCLAVLERMPAESVDAVVTDPPYALPGGFMAAAWDRFDGREDAATCYWIAGLIDGEGHFGIKQHTRGTHAPTFQLKMRADEEGGLARARRALASIGTLRIERREGLNDMVVWTVGDREGCAYLVEMLDKYPLRLKKRQDYLIWREAVCEWLERPRGNRWHGQTDNTRMSELRGQIMDVRSYRDPAWSGHEFQDWTRRWAEECFRVLKPGGHLLAFGGTRTAHRLACGIEDAGFEIRDRVLTLNGHVLGSEVDWLYGSGWPKSRNIGKAIDERAGATREVIGTKLGQPGYSRAESKGGAVYGTGIGGTGDPEREAEITAPATPEAARWEGWGTALKPAHEPIIVARKPPRGTVEAQVLATGTGAMNIDACRIASDGPSPAAERRQGSAAHLNRSSPTGWVDRQSPENFATVRPGEQLGRWPANVALVHSPDCERLEPTTEVRPAFGRPCADGCPVAQLDRLSGELSSGDPTAVGDPLRRNGQNTYMAESRPEGTPNVGYGDRGGASRFFATFQSAAREATVGACDPASGPAATTPSSPDDPPADSALSHAPLERSPGPNSPAPSTPATPSGSALPLDDATPTTPSTDCGFSRALQLARRSLTPSPASAAERPTPTDTTTTTRNRSSSGGSAEAATSASTSPTSEAGAADSAPRTYYSGKASPAERDAGLTGPEHPKPTWSSGEANAGSFQSDGASRTARNVHPTVKPIDLMRWLVRLVTPPGAVILDPFAGSGSTGCAAALEGVRFIGVERDEQFAAIARARIAFWAGFPVGTPTARVVGVENARRRAREEATERQREARDAGQLDLLAGAEEAG